MNDHGEPVRPSLPPDLVAHAVWVPTDGFPGRPSLVYATERARHRIAGATLLLAVVVLAVVLFLGSGAVIAMAVGAMLVVGIASVTYHRGGRGGFYELTDEGALGAFVGRQNPDLSNMRRFRAT